MTFTSTELAARIEKAESRMIEACASALGRRAPEADVFVGPLAGGVAAATIPGSPFNKIAGLGFSDPGLGADALATVEREYAARGIPVQAEVASLGDPSVVATLSDRGYRLTGFENVLGLTLADRPRELLAASDVEVSRCSDADWDTWLDVVVTGFETPDVQGVPSSESFPRAALEEVMSDMASVEGFVSYLARLDGQIAGGGGLRIDADGVAQLCGAATLPAARRRGVQTALLAQRLADAERRGCDIAVVTVQPGSTSCQNVQRWGFEVLYVRAVMVLGA